MEVDTHWEVTSGSCKWREADCSCEGVFFSQRVINVWNKLPSYVVEAACVNSFKKRLDGWSMDVESQASGLHPLSLQVTSYKSSPHHLYTTRPFIFSHRKTIWPVENAPWAFWQNRSWHAWYVNYKLKDSVFLDIGIPHITRRRYSDTVTRWPVGGLSGRFGVFLLSILGTMWDLVWEQTRISETNVADKWSYLKSDWSAVSLGWPGWTRSVLKKTITENTPTKRNVFVMNRQ